MDDLQRPLTRRRLLAVCGGASAVAVAGCTALFAETPFTVDSIWASTDLPNQSQPFDVVVGVRNDRASRIDGQVVVNVDGDQAASRRVTIDPDARQEVTLEVVIDTVGQHVLSAGNVQTAVRVQRYPPAFVGRSGRHLTDDCAPAYRTGANNFLLTDPYHGDLALVDATMRAAADVGLDTLRTWAFCAGEAGRCLQPEPETYDERAFRHLDYVIASAKRHGIKLVLALVNNWGEQGGMNQYVEWSDTARRHDDFYTDPECRRLYRRFVETVVTRTNTVTGLEYREDPTIMLWNLANEPRALSDPSGEATLGWFEEMASFLKSLDDNHLVTTGMEGFDVRDDWWSSVQGTDFVRAHQLDDIDVCSAHLHAGQWGLSDADAREWIRSRTRLAHETIGKPIVFGEFAYRPPDRDTFDSTEDLLARRDELFADWYETFDDADVDIALLWHFVGHDVDRAALPGRIPRSEYVVADRDERAVGLARGYAARVADRSCTGPGG